MVRAARSARRRKHVTRLPDSPAVETLPAPVRLTRAELDRLVRANQGLVHECVRKYRRYAANTPYEDLVAEGNLGLVEAGARFDVSRGYEFMTYAMYWVKARVLGAVTREFDAPKLKFDHVDEGAADERFERFEEFDKYDVTPDELMAAIDTLSLVERRCIERYFFGRGEQTLAVIGRHHDRSKNAIWLRKNKALAKLRKALWRDEDGE